MADRKLKTLQNLISDLIEDKISLTIAIHKAKKINIEIKDPGLGNLVELELTGLSNTTPSYRKVPCVPVFQFRNPYNGRIEKIENPHRLNVPKRKIENPISSLEEVRKQVGKGILSIDFTTKELELFDDYIKDSLSENYGWIFDKAFWQIHQNYITLILEGAKNQLLEHLNRIEKDYSDKKNTSKSKFFDNNSEFDSTLEILNVIKVATSEIKLVDNYIDENTLKLLSACESKISIKILTLPKSVKPHLELLVNKFSKQHNSLEVKSTNNIHDRFLIVDGSKYFTIGASLKDAGNKAFMFTRIEDPDTHQLMSNKFMKEWN